MHVTMMMMRALHNATTNNNVSDRVRTMLENKLNAIARYTSDFSVSLVLERVRIGISIVGCRADIVMYIEICSGR